MPVPPGRPRRPPPADRPSPSNRSPTPLIAVRDGGRGEPVRAEEQGGGRYHRGNQRPAPADMGDELGEHRQAEGDGRRGGGGDQTARPIAPRRVGASYHLQIGVYSTLTAGVILLLSRESPADGRARCLRRFVRPPLASPTRARRIAAGRSDTPAPAHIPAPRSLLAAPPFRSLPP
jgi:hypothetical protein